MERKFAEVFKLCLKLFRQIIQILVQYQASSHVHLTQYSRKQGINI